MIVVFDGPEAAGKSTVIHELSRRWPGDVLVRRWGPVPDWGTYVTPLYEDLAAGDRRLSVWDRSWAAEVVYNRLLNRGRVIEEAMIRRLLEEPLRATGGRMIMVLSPSETLARRREGRAEEKADLPVHPYDEYHAFTRYALDHDWGFVGGEALPEENARMIIERLRIEEQEKRG